MKFQKGSRVEVMNKTELPTSWCVAQVVSGNKYTYNLRYDCYPGIENVSKEFIRPCPPTTPKHWVAGDIVEVFDDSSWKTATVCNVSNEGHFLIRIHGFTHEIYMSESNIRTRQSWQHGQWIPIVKISGSIGYENVRHTEEQDCCPNMGLQTPIPDAKTCLENDNDILIYNDVGLHESHVFSKTPKRASPFCSSHLEASPKILKASDNEKLDAFAFSKENKLQASFYNPLNIEPEKGRLSEPFDFDSDQCSVGSCSIFIDGSNKWSSPCNIPIETNILSSDAESFNTSKDEKGNYSPTPEEDVKQGIHKLELHAYRSTLEALYVSGPLSWEKEALLTDLRITLHISNDQHLTELKYLISAGASNLY
ncbi:agenet domain-containing protein [Tanacetum coccineum]